ncbi:hypothetical protein ACNI5P_28850, partial [Klebsiella pneumoniae]
YIDFIYSIDRDRPLITNRERHHILPKSIFPEYNDARTYPLNIINLTPREHYIAHWILSKAIGGRMAHAFNMMANCKSPTQERSY